MKIGIIHPYFDVIGGAEMTSMSLIDTLLENKIKTKLYCVARPELSETDLFEIIQVKQKKFPLLWKYQRLLEVKKIFQKVSSDDIVFIMSGGLTVEKLNAKKTYLYCNSTFSSDIDYSNKEFHGIKAVYSRIIQENIKKGLKQLKEEKIKIISNSNFTQEEIKKNLNRDSVVIYPPVKIEKYKKFQSFEKENKIITISRFSAEKNLNSAINILNQADLKSEMIGNAKYKNQFMILKNLQEMKKNNVKIYSNISSEQISRIISTAKIYLHTSKETFGISVIEAIAAGCVPVVPNNSAHKETVPFSELRFNNENEAVEIIKDAVKGKLDYLLPKLQQHMLQFSEKNFQNKILKIVNS